jgi:hypothetical protein
LLSKIKPLVDYTSSGSRRWISACGYRPVE